MKAGHVVDLVDAEEAVRHAVDLAERNAKCQVEVGHRFDFGRPPCRRSA